MSDNIGGLSIGMVNLIVVLVILGAAFLMAMGWGFARVFNGTMGGPAVMEAGHDQQSYMRQVRYRTKLGMFVAGQEAMKMKMHRDSRATEGSSSSQY